MKHIYMVMAAVAMQVCAFAQTNPTAQALPYSQNFSSLSHASASYPAGWQGWLVATSPGSNYNTGVPSADKNLTASSTASDNSGNVHNYNGKIGFLNTGSQDLGLVLAINTTNRRNIQVSYDVMTIRNPYDGNSNTRINEVALQYRVGTTGAFSTLTSVAYQNNTTTQTSSVTTPQNLLSKSILLPPACDSEAVVQLRWISRQVSGAGSRPGFAVDNITVDTAGGSRLSVYKASDAHEAGNMNGIFIFVFNPPATDTIKFSYQISGTATYGTDYTLSTGSTIPPAGQLAVLPGTDTAYAAVLPVNDLLSEGMETVVMQISNPTNNYILQDSAATVNILDDESTPIHMIQGTGMAATAGVYTVEAIVTGVYPTLSPAGFYIQEEDADADGNPATSEGIFVVSSQAVSPGDKVRVNGTVQENSGAPSYNQAVLNNTTVTVLGSGHALPAALPISLPVTSAVDFERYEAMLVRMMDTLTVTDNYNLARYGEVSLSQGGMVYQATQFIDPNDAVATGTTATGASNVAAINNYIDASALRTVLLDDGMGTMTSLPFINANNTLRLGSTIKDLIGIMGYAFSRYRIQPIPSAPPVFNYAARPAVPSVGDSANVKVASFNVLNYFNGDGTGGGFPTARGAHSMAEFTRQRDKIISAIAAIDADILGLIELENDGTGTNAAIQDLVNGLNAKMGANTYSIINDGATTQPGNTDAIRCGIIYKSSVVSPAGQVMISANPIFNRPPVAQTFTFLATGIRFHYIVNHFKSKGCGSSSGADTDQADGQSCYNDLRKKQAVALMDFINSTVIPPTGVSNVLSMGDYNAYFQEDPMDTMRANGYHVLSASENYSYLFSGQVGSLDHAVVTDSMKQYVTGIAKWHINAAEPVFLDYNDGINDGSGDFVNQWATTYTPTPWRSSDHDPVIVGLDLRKKNVSVAGVLKTDITYKVYPNPVSHTLHIANSAGVNAKVQIMNMLGQVLYTGALHRDERELAINTGSLPGGMYIVRIAAGDGSMYLSQIVKE